MLRNAAFEGRAETAFVEKVEVKRRPLQVRLYKTKWSHLVWLDQIKANKMVTAGENVKRLQYYNPRSLLLDSMGTALLYLRTLKSTLENLNVCSVPIRVCN